jgi:membrane-bound lytic murein transglycosylase B
MPTQPVDREGFTHPHIALPEGAGEYAREVQEVGSRLRKNIGAWLDAGGNLRGEDACDVSHGALWQQRLIKGLVKDESLARAVLRRLSPGVRHTIAQHIEASRGLRALASATSPRKARRYRITPADDPHLLRRIYDRSQRDYGIDWRVLAALNFVESKFGRFMGPSSAGALGPMQFMPATWDAYGDGGDVMDPRDAIPAAARYLRASGAPDRIRDALYAYNRSYAYVDAVLVYARHMRRDPRNFYAYWCWQVFVMTTKGDKQLTEFPCRV